MTSYLNQEAIWGKKIGHDGYGASVFASDKPIKVRWEGKRRLVRDVQGREVVSESRVFCTEKVTPGDILKYEDRKYSVISVLIVPGLEGTEAYREVAV